MWESYTDPDGDSNSNCGRITNGDGYSHRNTNGDIYSSAALNSNTTASSYAAASPVGMATRQ